MEIVWSVVVGVFVAAGVYLMLEKHILRLLFGIMLLIVRLTLLFLPREG